MSYISNGAGMSSIAHIWPLQMERVCSYLTPPFLPSPPVPMVPIRAAWLLAWNTWLRPWVDTEGRHKADQQYLATSMNSHLCTVLFKRFQNFHLCTVLFKRFQNFHLCTVLFKRFQNFHLCTVLFKRFQMSAEWFPFL